MAATYRCDRCRQPIPSDRTILRIESGLLRTRYQAIDICPGCAESLASFLETPPTPSPATQEQHR